jgi:hypothetical protein
MNDLILKFQQIPKLLLGFIIIVLILLVLVYRDPPTTVCDIQMAELKKRLVKGFFQDDERGQYESGVMTAFNKCMNTNSPGGCYDIFRRFDYFEKQIQSVPNQCGTDDSALFVRKALIKALKLMIQIAWGEKPPVNRYNKTSWLDASDIGLFCRLKRQFERLYGEAQWKTFAQSLIPKLPEATTLPRKDQWDLSMFSYSCLGVY